MKKTWIKVKRGLMEPKHRERLGIRVWLYLYILDKADWETGTIPDWTDEAAAEEMAMPARTVRDQRDGLENGGYITCRKTQRGQRITIHNWTNPRDYDGKLYNVREDFDDLPSVKFLPDGNGIQIPSDTPSDTPSGKSSPLLHIDHISTESQGGQSTSPPIHEKEPSTTNGHSPSLWEKTVHYNAGLDGWVPSAENNILRQTRVLGWDGTILRVRTDQAVKGTVYGIAAQRRRFVAVTGIEDARIEVSE